MKRVFTIQKICVLIGICLLAGAMAILALWRWNINGSEKQAQYYVNTLQMLVPAPQSAVPEERRDNTMSVLSIDGIDFVGIVEFPGYGSMLPVCAAWGKTTKYPCHFSGSVYDGTLQIGATTQKGQYDFYRELSLGDTVLFTDMEGNCYTYAITGLHSAKHVDQAALQREEAQLTLFIKNIYSFEYLIVYCNVAM
jgi:hypothetical protein